MARGVACGMKYLAGINFIHRVSISNEAAGKLSSAIKSLVEVFYIYFYRISLSSCIKIKNDQFHRAAQEGLS